MFEYLNSWYRRYFSDPQAALMVVLLVAGLLVLLTMGKMLAPLLAAIVLAYLLEGPIERLVRRGVPRLVAVSLVFFAFLAFLTFLVLGLLPVLWQQLTQFIQELPRMINNGQDLLLRLPDLYPQVITEEQVWSFINAVRSGITNVGSNILSLSLATIPAAVTILVYLFLVPLMMFFFLKDKNEILNWMSRFLPRDRRLVSELWQEMDAQIGNYVRGKFYEIIIVGAAAYILFYTLGLAYAPLLAVMVGLSVLIPYIGAAAVTVPIALVGYFQWGWGHEFTWLLIWYFVLQFLDGNVLVPILFSEANALHPNAIIVAILVFGGIWGFWGVFFAIPLATLVKALINAWPTTHEIRTPREMPDDQNENGSTDIIGTQDQP